MLVLQQVNVLPKGAAINIYDMEEHVLGFTKSYHDGSLIFDSMKDEEKYRKVYSTFRVHELSADLSFENEFETYLAYFIQIRGE